MTRKRLSIIVAAAVSTCLIAGSAGSAVASAASLTGAGGTLVAPLEAAWAIDFERRYGESVTYAAVGSGAGCGTGNCLTSIVRPSSARG